MDKENRNIVILGGGESGTGSAVLAKKQGFSVFLSDSGRLGERFRARLEEYGIEYEEGGHSEEKILAAGEVIKSPGIPGTVPIVEKIRKKSIPILSEIEFAGRYTRAYKICITGSNGKTTTTSLIYHMLKKEGLNVEMAGNVGESFAMKVAEGEADIYVLELSSFQLDDMYEFRADIAVLMNITPDHLDRYDYSMQKYTDAKFRIIRNQGKHEHFIYCSDDPVIREEMEKGSMEMILHPFSVKDTEGQAAYKEGEKIIIQYKNQELTMLIKELALKGTHNAYNSMAAGITGQVLRIRKETIRQSLSDFQGVEHRLEPVIKVHGILFINDSKATNVNSTWYALESMNEDTVLILGGVDKGNDYNSLMELVKDKVKAIVCLGKDNSKILGSFGLLEIPMEEAGSMQEAVKMAYKLGKKGDNVLLSPACASFDLFDNYEDRGRQFKRAVREL